MYRVDLIIDPAEGGPDPITQDGEGTWLYESLDEAEAEAAALGARLRRLGRTGWLISVGGSTTDVPPLERLGFIGRHLAGQSRDRGDLITARDTCILEAHRAGATDAEIAAAARLDRSRVTRILAARVGRRGQGRRKRAE